MPSGHDEDEARHERGTRAMLRGYWRREPTEHRVSARPTERRVSARPTEAEADDRMPCVEADQAA